MFNTDYRFVGKHATYIKILNEYTKNLDKNAKVAGLFPIAVDVYMVAPLIGVSYNQAKPVDLATDDSVNILASQIVKRKDTFDTVYRLVLLADKSTNLTDDEKVARAFKDDEDKVKTEQNMELFHAYARGGIEWLYEQATDDATTEDDYIGEVNAIVQQFCEDWEIGEDSSDE